MASKPPDENDAKRAGTFTGDPFEGVSLLAPLSAWDLSPRTRTGPRAEAELPIQLEAPTFAQAYTVEHLVVDEQRDLISLAHLPSWPVPAGDPSPAFGQGWGAHLDDMLGGGLARGELLAIGAASAGAGKTAWVMQVADGLALRNLQVLADPGAGAPLTPVLVASEMSAGALSWRSLGRWTGYPAQYFRGGRTMAARSRRAGLESRAAWAAARAALEGELGQARSFMRLVNAQRGGVKSAEGAAALVGHLRRLVRVWSEQLATEHPGRLIVPVLVVDPLQRYQAGDDEVNDLNALARELSGAAVEGGWIALLTSDTNKGAATGSAAGDGRADLEEGAAVFRGSYKLMHEVTSAIYLRKPPRYVQSDQEAASGERHIEAILVKNRWGASAPPWPRYLWQPSTMRFYPQTRERAEQLARADLDKASAGREERPARKEAPSPGAFSLQKTRSDV